MKNRRIILSLSFPLVFALLVLGCASTAPLPPTLNIVPPGPDVPPEIAAFTGVWVGMWNSALDTILVVEKINAEQAEIIISFGTGQGFEARFFYATAKVVPGPAIEWTDNEGSKFTYTMDKATGKIKGSLEEKGTGAKLWAYMTQKK
ncbi:MAG: hypothetical protein C4538_09855 [Nitrospiraceae bacterium]|nr:MAG: hypothetical protein C4538_09855 [Nitrospiraceae bacterium]